MLISIVSYSSLEAIAIRLDPEYYRPDYLSMNEKLMRSGYKKIKSIAFVTDGIHESIDFDENSNIRLVSAKAPKENYFDLSGLKNISHEQNVKNPRTQLLENDIIISSVGTIGNCAVVDKDVLPANSDRHVGIIRLNNNRFQPRFVSTFLLSKYGRFQSLRESTGNVQLNLFVYKINEIIIPELTRDFQGKIENICQTATRNNKESELKTKEAEIFVLTELGLNNWKPKHQLSFIKNNSDIQQAERIDAEYYQPKYEEIVNAIKGYSGGWDTLDNLVHIKKCIEVGSGEYIEAGIPFVRVSNITPLALSEEKYISESLYEVLTPKEENIPFEKSKNHQPTQGEILFSKDGTPGIAYYLNEKPQKMIPSGGLLRLKSKTDKVNNEYLTLVLNSILTQEQVNRDVGGSIILHWRPDQVKETVIPILPKKAQTKIQQKVSESFTLRKQSKHLLACAKRAVEIAIEEDEETAMQWLDKVVEN